MALWIFLLLCELLCPAALILFGRGLVTCAEERSPKASVPVRCGKLWQRIGWIMLPATVLVQLLLLGKAEAAVGVWFSAVPAVTSAQPLLNRSNDLSIKFFILIFLFFFL